MGTFRRALGNGGVMLLSQVITWTATLVLTGALARYLGNVGFGNLYLATSMALIFSVLVNFGLDQQLTRAVARDKSLTQTYLINSLAIKTLTAGIAYLMVISLAHLLHYDSTMQHLILIYSLILFLNGYTASFTAAFQAHEYMVPPAVASIFEKVFDAAAAILLLSLGYGILAVAAVYVAGAASNLLWQLVLSRRKLSLGLPRIDRAVVRVLVIGALPFFLYWVLGSIYYRIDVVLLSKMTNETVVGWYGAAYRLFDTLVFLPNIVSTAIIFPILSRLSQNSRENFSIALNRGLQTMVIIGLPLCTGLFTLARPIISFVYGKSEFLPAVPALRWLALGLFVLYLNSILGVALISLNQERKMTVAAGIAIAVNLALNVALIPRYQHVAAAATTFFTELLLFGYLLHYLPSDLRLRGSLSTCVRVAAASAAMALVLTALRHQPLALLIPLGAAVYAAGILALGVVSRRELQMIVREVARRRAPVEGEAVKV
ncbi:MAG TPA: flippase [Thermomicrobiaceae bacterium]|nr:flippase [Thermomicrobiaceae bacterium]